MDVALQAGACEGTGSLLGDDVVCAAAIQSSERGAQGGVLSHEGLLLLHPPHRLRYF